MKKSGLYKTAHLIEDQYEPGSRGIVLRNLLHITRKRVMDVVEAEKYALSILTLAGRFDREHRFTAADICEIHRVWLSDIYEWAGRYRQVNISKDDFDFTMARYIPQHMQELESGLLRQYTPCLFRDDEALATALAVIHIPSLCLSINLGRVTAGQEDCLRS